MKKQNIKTLVYATIAGICLGGGVYFSILNTPSDKTFMETSVLTILKAINQDLAVDAPADLEITDVTLRKVYDPMPSFNYYKYLADITVSNNGGTLVNANVVIKGDNNQKSNFVRNTTKGFYLQKGGSYVIRDYEVLFDGDYNGGKINLTVEATDKPDTNLKNNSYAVNIFELPAKIKAIELSAINDDKSFVVNFDKSSAFDKYSLKMLTTRQYNFPEDTLKYAEVYGLGHVYGYYKTRISSDIAQSTSWQEINTFAKDKPAVKFTENSFEDADEHYLFIKSVNPENGYYVVSDIVKFPRYKEIVRNDFAKTLAEYTGTTSANDSVVFEDVNPEKPVTRGEVLKTVLDHYKTNVGNIGEASSFEDIQKENSIFPYAEALYGKDLADTFGHFFRPNLPATKDYLKFLIQHFEESSI
jgi:hypothetical protein